MKGDPEGEGVMGEFRHYARVQTTFNSTTVRGLWRACSWQALGDSPCGVVCLS